jgi:hypothetical protein
MFGRSPFLCHDPPVSLSLACSLSGDCPLRRGGSGYSSRDSSDLEAISSLDLSLIAIPNRYNLALLRDSLILTIRPVSRWKTRVQASPRQGLGLRIIQS